MNAQTAINMQMTREMVEIKRVKIRSIMRVVFLFHVFAGLIVGLLLSAAWGVVTIFDMQEFVPSFLGELEDPETVSLLILLSVTAIAFGLVGAIVWSLMTLLYNVIAGFVKGITIEVDVGRTEEKGDHANGG